MFFIRLFEDQVDGVGNAQDHGARGQCQENHIEFDSGQGHDADNLKGGDESAQQHEKDIAAIAYQNDNAKSQNSQNDGEQGLGGLGGEGVKHGGEIPDSSQVITCPLLLENTLHLREQGGKVSGLLSALGRIKNSPPPRRSGIGWKDCGRWRRWSAL